jgi:hypothetical protein
VLLCAGDVEGVEGAALLLLLLLLRLWRLALAQQRRGEAAARVKYFPIFQALTSVAVALVLLSV